MDQPHALLRALSALTRYFVADATVGETLTRVSEIARDTLDPSEEVGLTLWAGDGPATYVFTDPRIPEVDQAQYETGDGPCMDAFRLGDVVMIASTATSPRYRRFCDTAERHGFCSTLSIPMETSAGRVGAMNHYARTEDAFGEAQVALAQQFADHAAFVLANALAYWDARTLADTLAQAIESRATIEQAKGIIMAGTGVDADGAFDLLRQQSQAENVKLRDIAAEVVRRSHRPPT